MSVQSEINRLATAKTAIGTAISGKGVAVPSGTKLDGMAALVEAIEQGSDPVLQSKSVTPSETAQTVKPDSGYDGLSQVSVGAISKTYVGSSVPKQAAQTITPGTSNKTIASGRYLTGTQTVKGDANLVAGNIAKDVTIFGVTGTHEGGEDISAETAEYTSLLTDLETAIDALPDAGGGGGSVETCTVRIVAGGPAPQYMDLYRIITATSTGAYYADWSDNEYMNFDITIPNVLCKGIIQISTGYGYQGMSYVTGVAITGGAEMVQGGVQDTLHLFEIDASANESITIEFECESDY